MVNDFIDSALEVLQQRSKDAQYKEDPVLWAKEVLNMTLWSTQREIAQALLDHKKVAVSSCHGSGKGGTLNTRIPTPSGWTTYGEVRVGDEVLSEHGKAIKVSGKSQDWDRDCYVVKFDDGTEEVVNDVHEWNVTDMCKRDRSPKQDWREHWDKTYTYETVELLRLGLRTTADQWRFRVPLTQPLVLPEAELPIDPYLLGFWLGDGTSNVGNITIGEAKAGLFEQLDVIGQGYEVTDYRETKSSYIVRMGAYGFTTKLRDLEVLNNKHIPMQYLRASVEQRKALLAGLMDADGFLTNNNTSVGIDMTNKTLSYNIKELLHTLGVKVFLKEGVAAYTKGGKRHVVGTRYRMSWRPMESPFRIRCAEWKDNPNQKSRHTTRTIVGIEKTVQEPTVCIEVDSPTSLYLTGNSFVPTHNSHLSAVLAMWWVCTRQDEDAICMVSAPTYSQLHAIIFESLRKNHLKYNLPGSISLNDEWKADDGRLLAFGRKPSDQNTSAFQGIHRTGGVLVILDEGVGIHENIFVGAEAVTTGRLDKIISVFNPDDVNSYIGRAWQRRDPSWHFMKISAFSTPNFTGEYMPEEARNGLISPEWVEEKKLSWGEDSPRYKSKILGEFSLETTNSLFSPADVLKGTITEITPSQESVPRFGVDIARFGEDNSTVYSYQDGHVRLVDHWAKSDLVTTAERIHRLALEHGVREIRVDGVGVGAGVQDMLTRMGLDQYVVIGMVGNASSPDLDKWRNVRAYWYDKAREDMHTGKLDIDVEDITLADELGMITYHFKNQRSSLQIDSKEDLKARTDKSPDFADAFIYACADLGFDPEDPVNQMEIGEEYEYELQQLFADFNSGGSPF